MAYDLDSHLEFSRNLSAFWASKQGDNTPNPKLNSTVFNAIATLDIKVTRFHRTIVREVSERQAEQATHLNRAILECLYATAFILIDTVCIHLEEIETSKKKRMLIAKMIKNTPNPDLSNDFRALMYLNNCTIQKLSKLLNEAQDLSEQDKNRIRTDLDTCKQELGEEWYTILKNKRTFSGLSLAETTQVHPSLHQLHLLLYRTQCATSHPGDLIGILV